MDLKRPMAHNCAAPNTYPFIENATSMGRSHNPKYASYMGDGSGRDTYVVLNNGGLTNVEKKFMMSRPFRNTFTQFGNSP
jgi:hypothetical protein